MKKLTKIKKYRIKTQGKQFFNKNINVKIKLQIMSVISAKIQKLKKKK